MKRADVARILVLGFLLLISTGLWSIGASAEETDTAETNEESISGKDTDIELGSLKVSDSQAGKYTDVSFTLTGTENADKKYEVTVIEKVWIDRETDNFPLTSDGNTYKVTSGNQKNLECTYKLKLKDNLESGYYKIYFYVLYQRKATGGSTKNYTQDYVIRKSVDIKVENESVKSDEIKAENDDIFITMKNSPRARYGGSCRILFTAESKKYLIQSVVLVMDKKSPFQSNSQAYKVNAGNKKKLDCRYNLKVKEDVKTGYYSADFEIHYEKDGKEVKLTKSIQVYLQGKVQKKNAEKKGEVSVPRVMVTERKLNKEKIYPGDIFMISLRIRNTSEETLRNMKYTISSENGEFISVNGVNSQFVPSIPSGGTDELLFRLQANLELTSKSYQICLFAEYEDEKANGYETTDYVTIPIVVKDKLAINDIRKPEKLTVGSDGNVTFSINNVGENSVRNVSAKLTGDDFVSEKAFVGKIAAGASGYADIYVKGLKQSDLNSGKNATILISYVNGSGEKKSYIKKIKLTVSEEVPEDLISITESDQEEEKNQMPKQMIALVAILACFGIGGTYIKLKRNKSL